MIMGEHSVVYGHKAIATAVEKRLTIEWQTRNDKQIHIESELANHQTHLDKLEDHPKLKWVIATIDYFQTELQQEFKHGLNIKIHSEIDSTIGLGSSAAVLAALLGGLQYYLQNQPSITDNFKIGLDIIHKIQKRGSGTDLAASLAGGIILFEPNQQLIEKIETKDGNKILPLNLNLIYSGYKMPTADVLGKVNQDWLQQPELLNSLYQLMGETTEQAFQALKNDDENSFYSITNTYQGLMDALGVNDLMLGNIIYHCRNMPGVHASKISGSGLGDCVLALGELDANASFIQNLHPLSVQTSQQGLIITT